MNKVEKYIKDNNIKGYLDYDIDFEGLKKCFTIQEITKGIIELALGDDFQAEVDYICYLIDTYNFNLAIQNQDINKMLYYIYGCEFEVEITENGKINLIDLQNAYLGGKESYINFETIESALGRLSGSYLYDYFGIEVL